MSTSTLIFGNKSQILTSYVARVQVRISYPIRCGCGDTKNLKTSDMGADIYNKLLYKNKNKLYNK
jgi:hypothetical protein